MEKYLLEKSRLVYQEHNERWEKHVKGRNQTLRSCGGAVRVDVRMLKHHNRIHVSVCINDFCCLDSNLSHSATSVASGSLFGFAYFWSMKWVALSGPDTNVLDRLGRSGEGYPRHGGLTVGLLSSSPLIEMNCWLQGHKIICVCLCVSACVVGLCSHSCCTGLTFNLCAAASCLHVLNHTASHRQTSVRIPLILKVVQKTLSDFSNTQTFVPNVGVTPSLGGSHPHFLAAFPLWLLSYFKSTQLCCLTNSMDGDIVLLLNHICSKVTLSQLPW